MIQRTDYTPIIEKMKSKPGTWYKLNTFGTRGSAYTAALMLRKGNGIKAFEGKPGQFETKMRGVTTVWARYVGKGRK